MNNTKEKQKYDKNLLELFCKTNNIVLIHNCDKINSKTTIVGKCIEPNCNENFSKSFYSLVNYNAYCNEHSKINSNKKLKQTCLDRYGVENPFQNEEFKEKGKQTCLKRYGVENSMFNESIKEKIKQTCLERYGVENPFQNDKLKEKGKQTCLKHYGVDHALKCDNFKNKQKQTCIERYGVENTFQNEEIKEKIKNTCLVRYGVKHPLQNPEIMEKSSKKSYNIKNYKLPSGFIINYQGFENFALDELLQNGISENDIINGCKNVPEIWYNDYNGIKHRHFVDIFIPSQNKCIEVKSTWTAEKDIDSLFLKQKAAKELGYDYEIWVYDGKGIKIDCII